VSLDEFLTDNRAEIITRTRAKVASRSSPKTTSEELEHGVPLFLSQLSATLRDVDKEDDSPGSPASTPAISESAAEHGLDLFKHGFTIEQVVHDYGDICQAVTELSGERGATLTIGEFQTLNRCLDNAIAGAVSSWSTRRDQDMKSGANPGKAHVALQTRLLLLLDQAQGGLDALRRGSVGISGATGRGLIRSLVEIRALVQKGE
jgi:hypothetical protein